MDTISGFLQFFGLWLFIVAAAVCNPLILSLSAVVAFVASRYRYAAIGGVLCGLASAAISLWLRSQGTEVPLTPPKGMAWYLFPVAGWLCASLFYVIAKLLRWLFHKPKAPAV